jgi:CubicO group peptidase (beta-lactamase class C family)
MPNLDRDALRDAVAYVDQWIAFRHRFRDIPGLVIAVRYGDELALSKAYGFAQLDPPVPMTTRHIFRIASHSKTFTATAIMQLVEQGRLRLDDRASAYIPWLTSDATIRQLLNHVSGIIRDGVQADFWRVEQPFPDLSDLRALAPDCTILPTNTVFKYSNVGYALLGLVIQAVSGTSYNRYVKEQIVDRLGLSDTGPELDGRAAGRAVSGYTGNVLGVPRRAVPNLDTRALSPAAGFYSTAEDLCRYAAAHWFGDQTLLSDASKREMQHASWDVEQSEDQYGLGFTVQQIGERRLVGHGGGFPGQSTRTLVDPADQLVVVVLSNTSAPDGLAAPIAAQIISIIDFAQDRARRGGASLNGNFDRYIGRFANIGGVVDVVAFGNSLVALSPEADSPVRFVAELEVVDGDRLRIAKVGGYGSAGEFVQYEREEDGKVARIIVGGVSMYPEAAFRERYAEQPHWDISPASQ